MKFAGDTGCALLSNHQADGLTWVLRSRVAEICATELIRLVEHNIKESIVPSYLGMYNNSCTSYFP